MLTITGTEEQIGVKKLKMSIIGLFTLTNCTKAHEFECQNALYNEQFIVQCVLAFEFMCFCAVG